MECMAQPTTVGVCMVLVMEYMGQVAMMTVIIAHVHWLGFMVVVATETVFTTKGGELWEQEQQ